MAEPYICPMGIEQNVNEPCPRCGATEETDEGCLGWGLELERRIAAEKAERMKQHSSKDSPK